MRKAMVQIGELAGKSDALSFNQATRWVMTKEEHGASIIETVSNYMLAQRVKSELFDDKAAYLEALEAHHAVMQAAMKGKQVPPCTVFRDTVSPSDVIHKSLFWSFPHLTCARLRLFSGR